MCTAYLSHLPRKFMRTVSGHPLEGTYFNPRDTVKPPATLKKEIFPEVDNDLNKFQKHPKGYRKSLSEVGFLRLMDYLRTVFLQDVAFLRRCFPDHEIFKEKLFHTEEFNAFANAVCQAEDNPDWPEHRSIQAVVPEISAMLAGMRQKSSIGHNRSHTGIEAAIKELKCMQRNLLLNAETLLRIGNAQIWIPAVQAQLIMPPTHFTDQMLAPPTTQLFPANPPIAEASRSAHCRTPTELAASVAPSTSDGSAPQYEMDRTVTTVPELWEEWKFGRRLKPSAEELVAKWGNHWRAAKERGWFHRRQKLIDEIYISCKRDGTFREGGSRRSRY
jgi:hypothetical protein